jgi:alpha-galactosidase
MKFNSVVLLSLTSPCLGKITAAKPQMGKRNISEAPYSTHNICQAQSLTLGTTGWNSWNTFKANINESIIKSTAETLVSSRLLKAGYEYLILDEGWQALTRDGNGRQQANATKFPSGIPALADYVHKLGLKIGIYRYEKLVLRSFHNR